VKKVRLMGSAEIGARLGVTRSRAHAITRDRSFPEPYQTLSMGSVWDARDVEAWIREHRPALAEDPETD
jgi:predicted DNA-binding transcriptional regulator AlpA